MYCQSLQTGSSTTNLSFSKQQLHTLLSFHLTGCLTCPSDIEQYGCVCCFCTVTYAVRCKIHCTYAVRCELRCTTLRDAVRCKIHCTYAIRCKLRCTTLYDAVRCKIHYTYAVRYKIRCTTALCVRRYLLGVMRYALCVMPQEGSHRGHVAPQEDTYPMSHAKT